MLLGKIVTMWVVERDGRLRLIRLVAAFALFVGSIIGCRGASKPTKSAESGSPAVPCSPAVRLERQPHSDFFVAPGGSSEGDGSWDNPWDLATALAQPAAVHPGDTIWLRGGTYSGTFKSWLTGTAIAPVIVRQYPAERATIDGGNSNGAGILIVNGSYTWYWGFEIMSSDPDRVTTKENYDLGRGEGVENGPNTSTGIKLINLVIHDVRQGVAAFAPWVESEIYGCLIYYNGWQDPHGGAGHAIYTQNESGTKRIIDNIVFSGFSHGLHAYTQRGRIDNLYVEGNTFFNNGVLAPSGGRNLLIGGWSIASNPRVLGNFLYRKPGGPVSSFDMGHRAGCSNAIVMNNFVADNTYFVNCDSGATITGNTFLGALSGISASNFPNNTYLSSRPSSNQVFIRPNKYEAERANITVYNWELKRTVDVDLSCVLPIGSQYEIRNAQNFYAPPIGSGTYKGGEIVLPMSSVAPATPVGWPAPPTTGEEFQVFVVLTANAGSEWLPAARSQGPVTGVQHRTEMSR